MLRPKDAETSRPVAVYLDDTAVYGDTVEEVLSATVKTMHCLTNAGFMINLKKRYIIEQSAKVLGYNWYAGG